MSGELVPWWRSTQVERQSVAAAAQNGREMVLAQALDRIRARGMSERIDNAYSLASVAVLRMVAFDDWWSRRAVCVRVSSRSCTRSRMG